MDWEDRLDDWELELELNAQLEGSDWVTLEHAAARTGVSRAALRNWYRTGQIPSRLVEGPHGPQRLVPLAVVAAQLGHSDTRMVEKHYGHLAPNYIADTVRTAFGRLGIVEPSNIIPMPSGKASQLEPAR